MLHIWMITLFVIVYVHDATGGALAGSAAGSGPGWTWAVFLGPFAGLIAANHAICAVAAARLRRGIPGAGRAADRLFGLSRAAAIVLHACNVLVLGFAESVRGVTGDAVLIDELLIIAPPLAVFAAGWWSYYPIEAHVRNSLLMRLLDHAEAAYPVPTRRQFVLLNLRHQVLLALVPVSLITGWSEAVERGLAAFRASGDPTLAALADPWLAELIALGLQLVGVAAVFTFAPVLLRLVWDTVRLGPGPLRTRLEGMCRAEGVRIADILVWRTHGTLMNGAVMGLWGRFRYVLLTDALLDNMPGEQVEAVMAHELAHAKFGHLPWLAGVMMAGVGVASICAAIAAGWLANWIPAEPSGEATLALETTLAFIVFAAGLLGFGYASRRFEWQADAFAARCLTRSPPGATASGGHSDMVAASAADMMAGALGRVARVNHIAPERRSWRHGSIGYRQRRLSDLIGRPLDRLPIDRTARRIKRTTAAILAMLVVFLVWEATANRPAPEPAASAAEAPR